MLGQGRNKIYGKIFGSIYDGTLYGHWEAIVTLQQMLVLCDSGGVVDMTPQVISGKTSIPLDIITKGIADLTAPDPFSRTPGENGVRIALIDDHRPWGWYIVNHAKYQKIKSRVDKLESDRSRIAEKRKDNKNNDVAEGRAPSQGVVEVAHVDVPTDVPTKTLKPLSGKPDAFPGFTRFWKTWPVTDRKGGKAQCLIIWKRKGFEATTDVILAHVEKMKKSPDWRDGFDPMPATYLNQSRWDGADLDAPASGQKQWFINGWSGIVAKGTEHGLKETDYPNPPAFRAAVLTAAGITEAQVKQAEAQWK